MLSVLSYGRLVARAVIGGLSQTDSRDYSLVTASCGFGKDFRKGILKKGMCYGDDACFIARHRSADVLGECCLMETFTQLCRHIESNIGHDLKERSGITGGLFVGGNT